MHHFISKAICCFITILIFIEIAQLASKGELYTDLATFNSDQIIFNAYIVLGILLTLKIWHDIEHKKKWGGVILSFVYFYTSFTLFSDGHGAGWSHSSDQLSEKILMGIIIFMVSLLTVFIPLGALLIALLHRFIIKIFYNASNVGNKTNKDT